MKLAVRRRQPLNPSRDLFGRLLADDWFFRPWHDWREALDARVGVPPVAVQETDEDVVVTASLPGYAPDEIRVSYEAGSLLIEAEHQTEATDGEDGPAHAHGRLARRISLPVRTTTEQASARTENGVLTIRVPKAPEARAAQIKVEAA